MRAGLNTACAGYAIFPAETRKLFAVHALAKPGVLDRQIT
jgi:hypothetical protein